MKRSILTLLLITLTSASALADIVYITSLEQGCTTTSTCGNVSTNGTYVETGITLGFTGIKGAAPGRPVTPNGSRAYLQSAPVTSTTAGVDVKPNLAFNSVYQIDYNWNNGAGNSSTDVVMSATCTGGTLSFTETALFARSNGVSAQWKFMGYVTNSSTTPTISFRYQSGYVSATGGYRLLFDCWRFTLLQPCLGVSVPNPTGPLAANSTAVTVTGVSGTATNVAIYQDAGSGMTNVGSLAVSSPGATVSVPVTGTLVKGAQVSASQTVLGQESCIQTTGALVGGGANPRVRVAYSIRETSTAGPVGAPGDTSSVNIHFLGATAVAGGSPINAPVVYPSNTWQTVSYTRGPTMSIGDSANAVGTIVNGSGYTTNDNVNIQVYAFTNLPNGVRIFSANAAGSVNVTSNDNFNVNWTWDPVPGAEGYRLLRGTNFVGADNYVDVSGTNYADSNTGWIPGNTVLPNTSQPGRSVQWNPTVSNTNNLQPISGWGILESINFAVDDLTDSGPYDLYIDNLQNGTTVWQDFESVAEGTQDVAFRHPGFSGTTPDNILSAPDISVVSTNFADTGSQSLRMRFQWKGPLSATRWVRVTTSGAGNPVVNLDDPISIRLLLQPVSAAAIVPTNITINLLGNQAVLNWFGTHQLQAAPVVTGTYTNVPGVTAGPYTNAITDSQKFFRLVN